MEDSVERQKYILAAYNVGIGHMQDAIRLTKNTVVTQQNGREMLKISIIKIPKEIL